MAKTVTMQITGMHCKGCALGVMAALEKVPGVESAKASYPEQTAVVQMKDDAYDEAALRGAVKAAGFEVTGVQ